MTEKEVIISSSLQRLGFTTGNQIRLYGEVFELISEPIIMADNLVLVDATEKRSGAIETCPYSSAHREYGKSRP